MDKRLASRNSQTISNSVDLFNYLYFFKLIYKKKYAKAYKVSSNHSLKTGPEYAEAEWLSGWIALTFLDDPNMAMRHFQNFFKI